MAGLIEMPKDEVFCGAVIVSRNHAVTTAHCFITKSNVKNLAMLVGDHDIKTGLFKMSLHGKLFIYFILGNDTPYSQLHKLQSVVKHSAYQQNSDLNDIAIVRTVQPIEFNIAVGPVCLLSGYYMSMRLVRFFN